MWRITHILIALIGLGFVVAMAYNFVAQQNRLSELTAAGASDFGCFNGTTDVRSWITHNPYLAD